MIFNGAIEAAKEEGLRIATGTYTGNGKTGKANPVKIECPFQPKYFFAYKLGDGTYIRPTYLQGSVTDGVLIGSCLAKNAIGASGSSTIISLSAIVSYKDNVVSWYGTNTDPEYMLNHNANTYRWIAIG